MVIERAERVLHVAVIAHVAATGHEVVALVVLVERVRKFQIVLVRDGVVSFQSTREAAVTVPEAFRGVALAEEIAGPRRESQSLRGGEYQTLLDIEHGVSVDVAVIADLRVVRAFGKVDGVNRGVLHVGHGVEASPVESRRAAVPLFVVRAVASVDIYRPRLLRLAADDIHHAAHGIRAVERRRSPFHDFDALHVIHVQAAVIHVVERFARQALPVDEEQHRVAAESSHVERGLLVHRIGKLDARQFGL